MVCSIVIDCRVGGIALKMVAQLPTPKRAGEWPLPDGS